MTCVRPCCARHLGKAAKVSHQNGGVDPIDRSAVHLPLKDALASLTADIGIEKIDRDPPQGMALRIGADQLCGELEPFELSVAEAISGARCERHRG